MRGNLDNKTGENIIRVMDVWVLLDDKRVAALVADGMEGIAFSDDVDFVARPVQETVSPQHRFIVSCGDLFDRGEQDEGYYDYGTVP